MINKKILLPFSTFFIAITLSNYSFAKPYSIEGGVAYFPQAGAGGDKVITKKHCKLIAYGKEKLKPVLRSNPNVECQYDSDGISMQAHYVYANNPSSCKFVIKGAPRGIGRNRHVDKLKNIVIPTGVSRNPVKKNGKQVQLMIRSDLEAYLVGYFQKGKRQLGETEIALDKRKGRRGMEAWIDLSDYPTQCGFKRHKRYSK